MTPAQEIFSFRIQKILIDNGKEFTNRLFSCKKDIKRGQTTREHEFDQLCLAVDIEHRQTLVRLPQTNDRVERFNGRISEVGRSHHLYDSEDLVMTLTHYVCLYNEQFLQRALKPITPMLAMKNWYEKRSELFKFNPCNPRELDI